MDYFKDGKGSKQSAGRKKLVLPVEVQCCLDLCMVEFVQRPQDISNLAKDSF